MNDKALPLTARHLGEEINRAIDIVLHESSRKPLEQVTALIRAQHELNPHFAIDVVEFVARHMQGLTAILEAREDTVAALRLVEASTEVVEALRASVPKHDRAAFDSLLSVAGILRAGLRQQLEAKKEPEQDAEAAPVQPRWRSPRRSVMRSKSTSAFGSSVARGDSPGQFAPDRLERPDRLPTIERDPS